MQKYKFLIIVFFIAVLSRSLASLFDFNVQILYRVPFINIRWMDLVILFILFSYLYNVHSAKEILPNNRTIIQMCLIFLFFETFQLLRSWQVIDMESQISKFLCILSTFIVLDLSTYQINKQDIILFIRYAAISGAIVLLVSNSIIFYSFITGHVIFLDSGIRVGLSAEGVKEVISTDGLEAFVYAFGLYFIQRESRLWGKILFIGAEMSIFLSLVFSYSRGVLFTIVAITLIYITLFSKNVTKAFITLSAVVLMIGIFYIAFGNVLKRKGYDPVTKITQIAEFAFDRDNPDWDKGRSLSRKYALDAWEKNPWLGVGYDDLSNYGLPEGWATAHNFVITSLFHRGILGTFFYLVIIFSLYANSVKYLIRTRKIHSYQTDIIKLLIIVTAFWLVGFWTQEVIWEKYSLSLQLLFLGLISNYYKQRVDSIE